MLSMHFNIDNFHIQDQSNSHSLSVRKANKSVWCCIKAVGGAEIGSTPNIATLVPAVQTPHRLPPPSPPPPPPPLGSCSFVYDDFGQQSRAGGKIGRGHKGRQGPICPQTVWIEGSEGHGCRNILAE